MKLKSIEIKDFRGIKHLELPLHPQLTVLIGDNAAGKTTILEAIARVLSPIPYFILESLIHEDAEKDISFQLYNKTSEKDFRLVNFKDRVSIEEIKISSVLENTIPVEVEIDYKKNIIEIEKITYTSKIFEEKNKKQLSKGDEDLKCYALDFIGDVAQKKDLPILAFYGNNRSNFYLPELNDQSKKFEFFERLLALANALHSTPEFWGVFDWFTEQENLELRGKRDKKSWDFELSALKAVKEAICQMIPNSKNPRIELKPLAFLLDINFGSEQHEVIALDQMSDGYRTLLAIVIDLARRMAQGNPHLERPTESEAIVLIDEVDLHLHPKWQQTVLPDLMRTFPNTQFIVTTHSPQTLTTITEDHIIHLKRENGDIQAYSAPVSSLGAESGRLLESIMEVSERPPIDGNPFLQKLNEFFILIQESYFDEEKLAMAKKLLAELKLLSPDDPAIFQGEIKLRRLAKQLEKQTHE